MADRAEPGLVLAFYGVAVSLISSPHDFPECIKHAGLRLGWSVML